MSILEVKGLKKVYTTRLGASRVEALRNVNFSVEEGEYVAIMGESGSGKTTLLNMIAALDKPTEGEILLDGKQITSIRDSEMAAFRRDNLGFVFQEFNLLDTFTIEDETHSSNLVGSFTKKPRTSMVLGFSYCLAISGFVSNVSAMLFPSTASTRVSISTCV